MLKLALLSIIILGICIVMLCIGMIIKKKGSFPKTHVSQNKEMRKRGITCVQSQDYAARHRTKQINQYSNKRQ